MKKAWVVLLVLGTGMTEKLKALVAPPPAGQTVTLSWGDASVTNVAIELYQSTNIAEPLADWTMLATVTGTNAYTAPATSSVGLFMAAVLGEFATVGWNYPSDQMGPSLFFNLYWRPDASSAW